MEENGLTQVGRGELSSRGNVIGYLIKHGMIPKDREENDIKKGINKGRAITAMLMTYCKTERKLEKPNYKYITQQLKILSHMELKHKNLTRI